MEDRGVYSWSETDVGDTIERMCNYSDNRNGSRHCMSHRVWEDAKLSDCITFDTFRLQELAKEILVSLHLSVIGYSKQQIIIVVTP